MKDIIEVAIYSKKIDDEIFDIVIYTSNSLIKPILLRFKNKIDIDQKEINDFCILYAVSAIKKYNLFNENELNIHLNKQLSEENEEINELINNLTNINLVYDDNIIVNSENVDEAFLFIDKLDSHESHQFTYMNIKRFLNEVIDMEYTDSGGNDNDAPI